MTIELFSEKTVQEFFESVVTTQAERRVFSTPNGELCTQPIREQVDNIMTTLCPEPVMLDPKIYEGGSTAAGRGNLLLHTWLEYTGTGRLFMLRPRKYHSRPPMVTLLQPVGSGTPGRIIIRHALSTIDEYREYRIFAHQQFRMIQDYIPWLNEDLEYFEQSTRSWLWTLLQAKRKRLCPEIAGEEPVTEHIPQSGNSPDRVSNEPHDMRVDGGAGGMQR
ncbi:MAG: hypothetical protein JXA28_00970 [Bacteroidetes bacterium]|nr:hypothetical protein [Bacteroidota bacterium]